MSPQVEVLAATKSEEPSVLQSTLVAEGENQPQKVAL